METHWYAVRTRSRHEKTVERHLKERGITSFLPLATQVQRWSDRRKLVQFPLFAGYIFVRTEANPETRVQVLRVEGVVSFVGRNGQGSSIPDEQIEAVRTLITSNISFANHPFVKSGQRVRIRGGALDGMEGLFVSQNGDGSLVISIEPIEKSVAIRIEGYDVEPI